VQDRIRHAGKGCGHAHGALLYARSCHENAEFVTPVRGKLEQGGVEGRKLTLVGLLNTHKAVGRPWWGMG
jgi:hypothetical protein